MKYEDDIHNCTNERLAEMLEEKAEQAESWYHTLNAELYREAAARLREKHKEPFNHEAFSL